MAVGDIFTDSAWGEADAVFVVLDFLRAADAHLVISLSGLCGRFPAYGH
jgi:hypothetical protein